MAFLTKRLPVRRIPKKSTVTPMGSYVVYTSRHPDDAAAFAFRTNRMLLEKMFRDAPPPVRITAF